MADRLRIGDFDRPEVLRFVFYPRPDFSPPPDDAEDFVIAVAPWVTLHSRLYIADSAAPTILFFHGNGEVVSDYDDVSAIFQQLGINLWVVDYRGYGKSGGEPSLGGMLEDARVVLAAVRDLRAKKGDSGPLFVMGRSLGSASAILLAAEHPEALAGLIVESGFASVAGFFALFGLSLPPGMDDDLPNLGAIRRVTLPTLIIHAEHDSIFPLVQAQTLYEQVKATEKQLVVITGADHNDVMLADPRRYFGVLEQFVTSSRQTGRPGDR